MDGFEKLDVRIPAGFLEGLANIVPGVAGLNLKSMLDEVIGNLTGNLEKGEMGLLFSLRTSRSMFASSSSI